MTVRGLFREFVVIKAQREDARTLATFQAYQTVRIYAIAKKKGRLPEFKSLITERSMNTIDERMSPEAARAAGEMLAARAGTKVQPVNRMRLVRGLKTDG